MSEPTQQQKCADLARAMGYAAIRIAGVPSGFVAWIAPDGNRQFGGYIYESPEQAFVECAPDYFTNHAACHELVVWLATQSAEVWGNFSASVIDSAIPFDQRAYADWEMVTRAVMTAEPAIIAEAAWRAVQGEK